MATIKVPDRKNCHPYWPDRLRKIGYIGDLEIHEGVCSLVIPRPNTPSKDIAKDLRLLSQQFEYKSEVECRVEEVKANE